LFCSVIFESFFTFQIPYLSDSLSFRFLIFQVFLIFRSLFHFRKISVYNIPDKTSEHFFMSYNLFHESRQKGMSVPVSADPEYSVSGCSVRRSPVFPAIDKKRLSRTVFPGKPA